MTKSLLQDAFDHHVWATLRVIDACLPLTAEQLDSPEPGTYGPILETMRHLVGADAAYLFVISGGETTEVEEGTMGLPELRAVMQRNGPAWSKLLADDPDPDRIVVRHRDDGSEAHAALGIRLAQVIHHGTDHRSQICTALTTLGFTPPDIDVWDYAVETGRFTEVPAPA